MKITTGNTDLAVLAELGHRLERTRLVRNLTQGQLAKEAGVSKSTVERFEAGQTATLSSLIRVLRVLDLLGALDRLVPELAPSPIERLKLRDKQRQRATGARATNSRVETPGSWTWGDEVS